MCIRINKVEDISNIFYLDEKQRSEFGKDSITFCAKLGGVPKANNTRYYEIRTEEDALEMIEHVIPLIKTEAFPFFEYYSSLENLDKRLNNLDLEKKIRGPASIFTGLTIARLVNRPDFENVVEYYIELVKKYPLPFKAYYPDRLLALIDYLRKLEV